MTDEDNTRHMVQVHGVLQCPEHRVPLIIFSVKTGDGASPRYLFCCPENDCPRMLRVMAQTVSEASLLAIDGKPLSDP